MNNFVLFIKLFIIGLLLINPLYFLSQKFFLEPALLSEDDVFTVVNTWRTDNDYASLEKDEFLCEFARVRLNEIESDWSHDGFLEKSKELLFGSKYYSIGENLYTGRINNPEVILNMWLDSPTHKENIAGDYTNSCVECDDDSCVQIFAGY